MTTINQLLKEKGPAYFSVHPDETVYSAIKKMGEKGIGALLVMDRATLGGILTERDYARNVAPKGRSSSQTLVREITSTQCAYVEPDDTVENSLALMTRKRIRYPGRQGWSVVAHHFDRRPRQEHHRRPALYDRPVGNGMPICRSWLRP